MTYFRKKIHLYQEDIYVISRNISQFEFSSAMLREFQKNVSDKVIETYGNPFCTEYKSFLPKSIAV